MKKLLQKRLKNEKGLTLIELLAVIVILAIIAAIAIPAIGNIIENSRHNAARADVQNVLSAASLYYTETGSPDGAIAAIGSATAAQNVLGPYLDDPGNVTAATVTKAAAGNTITATVTTPQGTYAFPTLTNNQLGNLTAAQIDAYFTAN
ncbi:prepilin-type N-terminal cleavage/methylation domain-containing protein [Indiicoccus explosivorum]|uniref:prepilin-type N-terminal cleavage/methylation domain-containing protein n=1 Tax=Indiicoccus explosivorum TaxID=1917864 RepID=UPI000B448D48|nr:prepilin-type N-terminal cleavage/methylation domain-containing protein [Indiicoccus explosivorum]